MRYASTTGPSSRPVRSRAGARSTGSSLLYIQPRKPQQNAYIERFNRTHRTEVLDAYVFTSVAEVHELTERWLVTYNTTRPHDSLGLVPPLTFLPRSTTPPESNSEWSTRRESLPELAQLTEIQPCVRILPPGKRRFRNPQFAPDVAHNGVGFGLSQGLDDLLGGELTLSHRGTSSR